jgi:hypothetical protein
MAYWGEALAYNQPLWFNEDVAKARAALAKLKPTATQASSAREQGYLDAVQRLYGPGDQATRARAYADRMGELSRRFPTTTRRRRSMRWRCWHDSVRRTRQAVSQRAGGSRSPF